MKYDHSLEGLRLKPSADGLISFLNLTRDSRATLVGIEVYEGTRIRIRRDDQRGTERWARLFWIPLRGNRQWRRYLAPPSPGDK